MHNASMTSSLVIQSNIAQPTIRRENKSRTTAIKQAVMATLGTAFLPKITPEAELAAGNLTIVPIEELTIQRLF